MYAICYRYSPRGSLHVQETVFEDRERAEVSANALMSGTIKKVWQAWVVYFEDPRLS